MMDFRVDLDFIGIGSAAEAYGGKLEAWSFLEIEPEEWFEKFRQDILDSMGKRYLPIYRMADGEFRFLMGRKYNWHRKPLLKELVAVTAEKIKIKNPDKWKTSWGEEYLPEETQKLRLSLLEHIRYLSQKGYLACYINDNGLDAFTEYNHHIEKYFNKNNIKFDSTNYIPFHFVIGLFTNKGWEVFYKDKKILIVSGTDEKSEANIATTLYSLGVQQVQFLRISKNASMKEILELSKIKLPIDMCLVAAGIGSANILRQLEPLNTVVLDIGGYINCYIDITCAQHGGIFCLPTIQ